MALPHSTFRDLGAQAVLDAMVDRLGLPLMVKPDQGGSALGARWSRDAAELPAAMVGCLAYGDTVLVERFVAGVEVAVTVVDDGAGPRALPAVEIEPESGVYDYTARYTAGLTDVPHARPGSTGASPAALAEPGRRPRTGCSGCATCPAPTRSSTPTAPCSSWRSTSRPGLTETSLLPMRGRGRRACELGELLRRACVERAVVTRRRGACAAPIVTVT